MSMAYLRLVVAGSISIAGLATLSIVQAQQPAPGDDPHFTGVSTVLDGKDLSAARRRFEPGARSAWHTHDNGQLLFACRKGACEPRSAASRRRSSASARATTPVHASSTGMAPCRKAISSR